MKTSKLIKMLYGFIIIFALLGLYAKFPRLCENRIIEVNSSKSGGKDAIVFERSCGATTGFSSQVSIMDAGDIEDDGGNTFIADTDHGAAPAAEWGGPWVGLKWLSDTELQITHHAKARVHLKERLVDGIVVTYQTRRE